jgi:hypothetical protein
VRLFTGRRGRFEPVSVSRSHDLHVPLNVGVGSKPGFVSNQNTGIVYMQRLLIDKIIKREPKKPYSKPTLTLYGTVRELTQSVGTRGNLDGILVLRTSL